MRKLTFILSTICIALPHCLANDNPELSAENLNEKASSFGDAMKSVVDMAELTCDKVKETCEKIADPVANKETLLKDCIYIFTEFICNGKDEGEDLKELYKYFTQSSMANQEKNETIHNSQETDLKDEL